MFNKNIFKSVSVGACLAVASMGTAFAQSLPPDAAVVKIAVDEAMYEVQAGFDKVLFEEKAKEIEEKGITVTHTSPIDGYVEVGITPFSQENKEFIENLLGGEQVTVVEGNQAVLYTDPLMYTTSVVDAEPSAAPEAATSGPAEEAPIEVQIVSTTSADDIKTVSAQEESKDATKTVSPLVIGAGAALLLGIGTLIFKKRTA
ncbi:MAG: hypothetical protein AAGU76_17870 [Sedimentibacter sp.]|uniref:hypothetical protein n=1 Tax=Sedimentibacter sp. TaxID=1960295 RepID=UPI0031596FFF